MFRRFFFESFPYHHQTLLSNSLIFRKFLLVKCINGEKATYNTSVFSTKRERTFQILLEDAHNEYGREPNSKQSSTILDTLEGGHTMLHSYK